MKKQDIIKVAILLVISASCYIFLFKGYWKIGLAVFILTWSHNIDRHWEK